MGKEEELPFATNHVLSQVLICLVDLNEKLNQPTGDVLYALNKNMTALTSNAKEVEASRISLLKEASKLSENGEVKLAKQGSLDDNGNEIDTAVFKSNSAKEGFFKEYNSLMDADNKDFKFFKIPLSKWMLVKIKEGDSVKNLAYLFEYIINEYD